MARWIFRRTKSNSGDTGALWIWQLEDTPGAVVMRWASQFPNITQCMSDAAHQGYYGGHYAVTIRTDYCGPQPEGSPNDLANARTLLARAVE
jgi:hypothetical protein